MSSHHFRPTSVTIGCTVEAVVNSGEAKDARELVHQVRGQGLQDDDDMSTAWVAQT